MSEITRDEIVASAKKIARRRPGPLSRSAFTRLTGISAYFIYRHFPEGGWKAIEDLAGLPRHRGYRTRIADDDLLAAFHRVASELGQIPTGVQLQSRGAPVLATFHRRFGAMPEVLLRYEAWLAEHEPDSPLLASSRAYDKRRRLGPRSGPRTGPRSDRRAPAAAAAPIPTEWPKRAGVEYGAPLNFRGLRHEPTNEQGVVYLFGMVSDQLGLVVESMQTGFPDCEAKRCVDLGRNRWQRVRIEFEYLSRNFHDHHHDARRCDMIVCWEHDWPECPLEVIELRSLLKTLGGAWRPDKADLRAPSDEVDRSASDRKNLQQHLD